ncbi:GMC oxidoreductase [Planktomarina temperata]|nr:GMC oxidoreductase [Planktomarina temperata]
MQKNKQFDLVIIGSGPAAWSFLTSYAESNKFDFHSNSILVAELGPTKSSAKNIDEQNFYFQNVGHPFRIHETMSSALGGTSNLWHGVIAPMDPIDFTFRDYICDVEWPIRYQDLIPWYKWVCAKCGWGDDSLFDMEKFEDGADLGMADRSERIFIEKTLLQTSPVKRFAADWDALQKKFPNVEIATHTRVTKILAEQLSGDINSREFRVAGIKIVERNEKEYTIKCNQVVLAGGALHTPILLLNSFPDWHRKNPTCSNWIGRNLMDHPMGPLCLIDTSQQNAYVAKSTIKNGAHTLKSALRLSPTEQQRNQLANTAFYLRPTLRKTKFSQNENLKASSFALLRKLKNGQIDLANLMQLIQNPLTVFELLSLYLGHFQNTRHRIGYFITEQRPFHLSRVMLSQKQDKFGFQHAQIDWQINPQDIVDLHKYLNIVGTAFFTTETALLNELEALLGSAAHHLGTCRMANSSELGVTNSRGEIFNLKGSYVVDGSVFVTSGNANPTLTIMANSARVGNQAKCTKMK